MKFYLAALSLLATSIANGSPDYSTCNHGLATGRISKSGDIEGRDGLEKISKRIQTKDGIEVTFEGTDPRFPYKETIIFNTDSNGRIVGYTQNLGYSQLSKKEKNQIKYNEAYLLANGNYPGQCAGVEFGSSPGSATNFRGDCSGVFVHDDQGNRVMLDYDTVTKKNFNEKKMGMSWELFSQLKSAYQKQQDVKKRLAQAYMGFMDDKGWLFPTGEKATFKVNDTNCSIEKIDKLLVNTVNNSVVEHNTYNADSCDKMILKLTKAQDQLMACSAKEKELVREILGIPQDAIFISQDEQIKFDTDFPQTNRDIINKMVTNCNMYGVIIKPVPSSQAGWRNEPNLPKKVEDLSPTNNGAKRQ